MSASATMKTYDELIDLLKALDNELGSAGLGEDHTIVLDAVGGFSLMYYGMRGDHALSRDIDIVNKLDRNAYEIAQSIDSSNWLNDDIRNVLPKIMPEIRDHLEFAEDTRYKFKHIRLRIATLDTVFRMKLDALLRTARDGHGLLSTQRLQDVSDLRSLLGYMNIKTEEGFLKEFPSLTIFVNELFVESDEYMTHTAAEYQRDAGARQVNIFEKFDLFDHG
ncbi:MAG: hypothetical protein FWG78_03795 [Coriobacteriia bacterium]|nr:hypothetical protein [Coriobacteriia bacterium]